MKKFLKIFIPLVIVVAVAAGGYIWYKNNQGKTTAQTALPKLTQVSVTKGSITTTVGATGNVRATQTASIAWQTQGRVASINVKVGDSVQAGQVLASLDPNSLSQSMAQAKGDLITAQTNLDNLKTIDPVAMANAEKAVMDAQNALELAQNAKDYLNYKYGPDQIAAAQAQVVVLQNTVDQLQAAYPTVKDRPNSVTNHARALKDIADAEGALRQAQNNLAILQGPGPAQDLRNADAAITVAQAQLQYATDTLNQLKAGPKAADLQAAQAKIDAIQAELDQQQITAPFSGTVTDIGIQPGDLVSAGKVAFRIDIINPLYLDVQVSELDINKVQVGQPVDVTFDGIPNKAYTGSVTEVSSVGVTSSGVVNFDVIVAMQDPDAAVRQGMSASANIVTTRLKDVLVVPVRAVTVVNNQHTVLTQDSTGLHPIQVQVGATDDVNIQILSGVTEGEKLVIIPQTASTSSGQAARFGPFGGLGGAGGFHPGD